MKAGLSPAYKKFADPIDNSGGPGGFDAHIYFDQVGVTVVMVVVGGDVADLVLLE